MNSRQESDGSNFIEVTVETVIVDGQKAHLVRSLPASWDQQPTKPMSTENLEAQQRDSDMIFAQITSGDFDNFKDAEQAVALIYAPDKTISRAGISHALKRLEQHFKKP